MKIVCTINTLRVGGAAKMLKYVTNILTSRFEEVVIIDLYDQKYEVEDVHPNIRVLFGELELKRGLMRRIFLVPVLRNFIVQENPDFILSFISHVNVISRLATLGLNRIVFISAERGDPYTLPFFWSLLTRWTYNNSDYCFFQLAAARDYFSSKVKSRSFVIPNPILSSECLLPFKGERNKTIVSAGRFSYEKRYDILIKAFSKVLKVHSDYKLILVGDGPLLEDYKSLAKELGISHAIRFPGYVKSIPNALYREGIFVLSSFYEGMPNSLIEAMSVGLPCVATDCTPGGPRFLSKGGERLLLVPVNDVEALVDALMKLIENRDLARSYGDEAIKVLDDLNESTISKQWTKAFDLIIKRNHDML